MAKLSNHVRSLSLPSSSLIVNIEQQLERLKLSKGASTSSQLLACQKLDVLKTLYECPDDVLQLRHSQQPLSHVRNGKWEEEVLDGSLRLLDVCGIIRDIYCQMKEILLGLEASLRRKRYGELANEVDAYMISRKKLNKMINKCNKDLKRSEQNCMLGMSTKEFELVKLISGVQEVSMTMLESTLSFISRPKASSLVSRLIHSKHVMEIQMFLES